MKSDKYLMNISQIIANPFYYPNSSIPYYTSGLSTGDHNDPHSVAEFEPQSYFDITRRLIIKFSSRGHNLEVDVVWMVDMINVFFLEIFGSISQIKMVFERLLSEFQYSCNDEAVAECKLWLLVRAAMPASEE